jgi:hypothetical protein
VNEEFAARRVVREIIEHLERRRADIAGDEAAVRREMERALVPLREAYKESALPPAYFAALEQELGDVVPTRWREVAASFTAVERKGFGSWRGGDVYARVAYVFIGLLVGGLCVKLPFIPIWEKWFPFALAGGAWWLPDAQAAWHRRSYARRLGEIVRDIGGRQGALEAAVTLAELEGPSR